MQERLQSFTKEQQQAAVEFKYQIRKNDDFQQKMQTEFKEKQSQIDLASQEIVQLKF